MAVSYQKLDLHGLFPNRRDAFAVVVDGLFTKEECDELIRETTAIGYTEALVGKSQVRVAEARNNWRCIVDDVEKAKWIFERVRPYVPSEWLGKKVVSLNERLRFLKYKPGEYFKPHNDGIYVREGNSQASFVTVHLYLNDVPEGWGGETTFTTEGMNYGRHRKRTERSRHDVPEDVKTLRVRPVTGRVLIFEHHLPHEGSTLLKGVKYTLRTDVMYDLAGTPPVRTPRWGQKFPHPQWKADLPS
jgi:2-oxoglutarate-Fe(II)-dependent oxygenase superfamily protein